MNHPEIYYKLKDKKPVACELEEWGRFMQSGERRVDVTMVGDVRVSTVFLGLDHSWFDGPMLLFETMIFGGEHDEYQTRCSTWEQAEEMHAEAVAVVKGEKC